MNKKFIKRKNTILLGLLTIYNINAMHHIKNHSTKNRNHNKNENPKNEEQELQKLEQELQELFRESQKNKIKN